MNMKKIFVLAATLLMTASLAMAQELSVNAGYIFSTLSETSGNQGNKESTSGVSLGASYNIPIADNLGIAPGLYYSLLTGQGSGSLLLGLANTTVKFSEHAINLPVHLNYTIGVSRHANLYLFAGPTFQVGLSSKYKAEAAIPILNLGAKTVIDNYEDLDMNRFNIFLGGGAGMDLNSTIRVTVGFDYGLLNLSKNDNVKSNRYNLKIGVAYLFD